MKKNILVFIPNTLEKHKSGYLKGCHRKFEKCEAFYVTEDVVSNNNNHCIGYIGRGFKSSKRKIDHCLFINSTNNRILINNEDYGQSVIDIIYDYPGLKNSEIVTKECGNYGKHFTILSEEIRKSSPNNNTSERQYFIRSLLLLVIFMDIILKIIGLIKPIFLYWATFLHFEESLLNVRWFLDDIVQNKKVTPKSGNILVAKIVDLLIGIGVLNFCLEHENDILNFIEISTEDIITNLKGLLLYLMGAPIGLKLNHAFNNVLGKFFFYHISLWRIFLQGIVPLLRVYFRYLVLPAAFGFSFQIAMLSDIISIATFHVYCIYVYAARLFHLQLKGLVSLWRLFIGRKFNPLRQRVDSCRYTPDQLFIGTLGFTILLFLLPTTAMYYTVFTTFRLAIVVVNGALCRIRFLSNVIPLHIVMLWVFSSSSLAGNVAITWKNAEGNGRVTLEAKLRTLPLTTCIKKFVPGSIQFGGTKSLGTIFHSVLTGVLL